MKKALLSVACLVLAAGLAAAGGFTPSTAPARALWVCHLDLTGLKRAAFGKALLADPRTAGAPQLAGIAARFGLDPLQDLRGMTLYTVSTGRLDAVAVFDAEPAAAAKLAAWRERAGMTAKAYGAHTIFSRSADEGMPFQAVASNGLIVAALSRERMEEALAVLDGKASAMGADAWPALADRDGGTGALVVLAGRAFGSDMEGLFPQLSLLKHANSLCLTLGEQTSRVKAVLSVCADEDLEAERLQNALLGLVEIGRAMAENGGKTSPLESVAVARTGRTIHVTGDWPAEEIVRMTRVR